MSDRIFHTAYARARARHTEETWLALSPRQITDEIYREIKLIDAERAAQRAQDGEPGDGPDTTAGSGAQ